MKLADLAEDFGVIRSPGWLVLADEEVMACLLEATRFYAAYGNIASLSKNVTGQSAPGAAGPLPDPVDPVPEPAAPALPIRDLRLIKESTDLTVGEWAIVRPLFWLYVERENAMRLEASRASGLEVYGRGVSEIAQEIAAMEADGLPSKAFFSTLITVE